jgi:methylthioribose-1-phosphate isomerase
VANGVAGRVLGETRPTAVNLAWAIARMAQVAGRVATHDPEARYGALLAEAEAIHREGRRRLSRDGARSERSWCPREPWCSRTCNAGALATGGYGTALGVIRAAHAAALRAGAGGRDAPLPAGRAPDRVGAGA